MTFLMLFTAGFAFLGLLIEFLIAEIKYLAKLQTQSTFEYLSYIIDTIQLVLLRKFTVR